ncbi:MAG: efflux RND transporter periplasmic adaptor subunit [Rhizobiales bacterium]|nr:efflux RND transporter periplasmic adaptor subunit [Hyphomicrobiales bacterium]
MNRDEHGSRHGWIGASVAVLFALGVAACEDKKASETAPPPAPPPSVTVVKATRIEVTPSITFTGRIEAIDKVELRARVEGFIDKRLFQEGASVKPGELMFVMEKDLYQATVDQTQAELAGAQAQLKLADIETDRTAQLVAKKVKAQQELDIAIAKQSEARANVDKAQAELEKAKLNLGFTDIFTPLAGRVGRAVFSVGDYVNPSSGTLTTVVSQDPIRVAFPVTSRELLDVRRRATEAGTDPRNVKVGARLADGSVYPHDGSIDFLGVEVDPTTDSLTVRAQLPNPDGYLVDGQLVTAIVKADKPEKVLVVPYEAMQIDQIGRYVLTLDAENKVRIQRIETGATYSNNIVVTQGLKEGDRVITIGVQKVRPDMVVDPIEASLEASPS